MENVMNPEARQPVTCFRMRAALIKAAETIENGLKDGSITPSTRLETTTSHGFTILWSTSQKSPDKPVIITAVYSVNKDTFQQYTKDHPELTEGPLIFMVKGIEVTVVDVEKIEKTGFCIDELPGEDAARDRIWLELFDKPATFIIHRDLFQAVEWSVSLEM